MIEPDTNLVTALAARGITFHNQDLLRQVVIHRSFLNEHPERLPGLASNERLEFLGDAVLNMIAANWLYVTFPQRSEGELTVLRAALIKTPTLARFARVLDLGAYIRLSRGEDNPATRARPGLLADMFEALLAAIYLDQGLDTARRFLEPFLVAEEARIATGDTDTDYRTRLQELVQAQHAITPAYRIETTSGPDHRRVFTVGVYIGEAQAGVGSGTSKQTAAQAAARSALAKLEAAETPLAAQPEDLPPG